MLPMKVGVCQHMLCLSPQTEAEYSNNLLKLMGTMGATGAFVAPATNRSALLPLVRARCYTL